jgi:hypothetical protein
LAEEKGQECFLASIYRDLIAVTFGVKNLPPIPEIGKSQLAKLDNRKYNNVL